MGSAGSWREGEETRWEVGKVLGQASPGSVT